MWRRATPSTGSPITSTGPTGRTVWPMRKARSVGTPVLGFLLGGVLGVAGSVYNIYAAQAAVRVRPHLAGVGFVDAALAGHAHDWVFYHYPTAATLVTVSFLAVFTGIVWLVMCE